MSREPIFSWDEEAGVAICTLFDGNNTYTGVAVCAPEDFDMKNEKTGCQIAEWRAELEYFIHVRDNELKPEIKALKQLYYGMNQSTHFNENSYENLSLQRLIRKKEFDLTVIKEMIADQKRMLKEYLEEKGKFYKRIRANREADRVGQK